MIASLLLMGPIFQQFRHRAEEGGVSPIATESFEGASTASTCDELTGVDNGTRDCDYVPGAITVPDGSEVARHGPLGSNSYFGNDNFVADDADGIGGTTDDAHWVGWCFYPVTGSGTLGGMWGFRTDAGWSGSNINWHTGGSSQYIVVTCTGGTSDTSANDVFTEGQWNSIIVYRGESTHVDSGVYRAWVNAATTDTATAEVVDCSNTANVDGFFLQLNSASQENLADQLEWYVEDPVTITCP